MTDSSPLVIAFSCAVAILIAADSALAVTVSVGAARDNTLYEDVDGGLSNGAGVNFFAGQAGNGVDLRGLIKFDLTGEIPVGAAINSATLTLHMSKSLASVKSVELRRVLADWGEAGSVAWDGVSAGQEGGGGAPAETGDATWTHSFTPATAWNNVGGDFSSTVSASHTVGGVGFYTWGSTEQMISDVQDWLDNPAANFGWLVLGEEGGGTSAKRFDSRENSADVNRPLLTIDYELAGLSADFDGDGDVDGNDLATWEGAYGLSAAGDTNNDGNTRGDDFLQWQRQFTGPLLDAAAVPEPTAAILLLTALTSVFGFRR